MIPMPAGWESVPPKAKEVLAMICVLERPRIATLMESLGRSYGSIREAIRYLQRARLVYRRTWGTYAMVSNPPLFRSRYIHRYDFSARGVARRKFLGVA